MSDYKQNQINYCKALLALCKEHKIERLEIVFTQKIEDHSVTFPVRCVYGNEKLLMEYLTKKEFK